MIIRMIANEQIFKLIKKVLHNDNTVNDVFISEEDFNKLKQQSIEAVGLGYIKNINSTDEVKKSWEKRIFQIIYKYSIAMQAQDELIELLENNKIKVVTIKGSSAAMYYPRPVIRSVGDIDIIVKKSDFEKAERIMKENGYIVKYGYNYKHIVFEKNGIDFELHKYFSNFAYDDSANYVNEIVEKGIDSSIKHSDGQFSWNSFDTNINGLVILQHLKHHLYTGVGLRHILDWMMFVKKEINEENWKKLKPILEKSNNMRLAKLVTRTCVLYLGLPDNYSWCKDVDEDKCYKLLDYIFIKGNMGHSKNSLNNRTIRAFATTNGSIIKRFKGEQAVGMQRWEAVRKHKALKPFAWIYGIFYHIKQLRNDGVTIKCFINNKIESRRQLKLVKSFIEDE